MERHMKTLCLNKGYVPVRLGSPYEAVGRLYSGSARAIYLENGGMVELGWDEWWERSQESVWEEDQWFFRATHGRVAVPRVIRYQKYNGIPKASIKLNRKNIYFRDGYKCYICGREFEEDDLSIDHIVPASRGGKREWTNLITCCKKHNKDKEDKLLSELGWKPKFQPFAPKGNNMSRIKGEVKESCDEWRYFGI